MNYLGIYVTTAKWSVLLLLTCFWIINAPAYAQDTIKQECLVYEAAIRFQSDEVKIYGDISNFIISINRNIGKVFWGAEVGVPLKDMNPNHVTNLSDCNLPKMPFIEFVDEAIGAKYTTNFSKVVFTKDGQYAYIAVDMKCRGWCGQGYRMKLIYEEGIWRVVNQVGTWIA